MFILHACNITLERFARHVILVAQGLKAFCLGTQVKDFALQFLCFLRQGQTLVGNPVTQGIQILRRGLDILPGACDAFLKSFIRILLRAARV
jgi:hypothetical protein